MKRTNILKSLIKKKGFNLKEFSNKINIPYTTLHSILKRGIGNASVNNVIKICDGLNIKIEDLENRKEGENIRLTDEEKELIKKYRKLTERQKIKLEGIVESYIIDKKEDKKRDVS